MRWAFIYTLDEPGLSKRVDTIGPLTCIGVPNVADAPAVARELVANGVEAAVGLSRIFPHRG